MRGDTEDPPVVRARDIEHAYPGREAVPVLRGVSLDVRRGEMLAVVGPSGSGKSTLLACLSGLERPLRGAVEIEGTDIGSLSRQRSARFRRGRVGFVFQSYNLIPALTARENVALPARLAKRPADRRTVDAALDAVGMLGDAHRYPDAMSGGQQQRVAIARTLVARPRVLFADEPTGALDTVAGGAVLDLLRQTASGERSVVMVTHDLAAAARADRVVVLRDGVVHAELVAPDVDALFDAVERAAARA
ncbi:ABC transporter ATP-binding protein [Curtobacterium sp. A7_M15]|uniref:ABC transporter ATP-binding protein n=1 Tax=Curtobacterium sp. A7_M15 TaxID=3065241 RepID=UPI0027379A90|nr:ABC transporter ATP-binding protein [Curtobacterium sp. A7_M15]MDP4332660.1 ABC transporter ATP-binding protein [Curtobacterium sp. A7_M15]